LKKAVSKNMKKSKKYMIVLWVEYYSRKWNIIPENGIFGINGIVILSKIKHCFFFWIVHTTISILVSIIIINKITFFYNFYL
jgi:hypothetical protein